jgi:L-ascorbate metabolism protein UlaG (beta-lactamase superfamily)
MLNGSPEYGISPSPVPMEELYGVNIILITHSAADHVGQAFEIMEKSQATLVCDGATGVRAQETGEISNDRIYSMISGVRFQFGDVKVKALPAQHTSRTLTERGFVTAQPLSYILTLGDGEAIFFGGDTSIHSDLKLFGELYRPHVAMLGVGGVDMHGQSLTELYPDEAALAAKWLGVRIAVPMHYRLDEGKEFLHELKDRAPDIEGKILKPGERFTFSLDTHP